MGFENIQEGQEKNPKIERLDEAARELEEKRKLLETIENESVEPIDTEEKRQEKLHKFNQIEYLKKEIQTLEKEVETLKTEI